MRKAIIDRMKACPLWLQPFAGLLLLIAVAVIAPFALPLYLGWLVYDTFVSIIEGFE